MSLDSILIGQVPPSLSDNFGAAIDTKSENAIKNLVLAAESFGFKVKLASGWRSYDRQMKIWNDKAQGLRPILNEQGEELDRLRLSDEETMWAILKWSALPGASRHHWGSDFDIFEQSLLPEGYQLQLTLQECESILQPFYEWLNTYLENHNSDFFRPYFKSNLAIASEPWHLSYAPLASEFQKLQSKNKIYSLLSSSSLQLKKSVLKNFDEIYERYIYVPWSAYPKFWRP